MNIMPRAEEGKLFAEGQNEKFCRFCWAEKRSYYASVELSIFKYLKNQ
jgi:hypothetical protein